MKKLQNIALVAIIPIIIVILLTYMLTTDTSQARHDLKCMAQGVQIDEERYKLDNGISDKWAEWREDFAHTFLVGCGGFAYEEALQIDPYV